MTTGPDTRPNHRTFHAWKSSKTSKCGSIPPWFIIVESRAAERSLTSQNHHDGSRAESPIGGNLPPAVTRNQPWYVTPVCHNQLDWDAHNYGRWIRIFLHQTRRSTAIPGEWCWPLSGIHLKLILSCVGSAPTRKKTMNAMAASSTKAEE